MKSLSKLGLLTFNLLSKEQRSGALKHIIFSVIQAFLEVISIAVIIPLLYIIVSENPSWGSSSYVKKIYPYINGLSWMVILTIIIAAFILKNIISLWLTHFQSQYIKKISIAFTDQLCKRFYQLRWTDYLRDNSSEIVRKIKTTPSDFANYVLNGYLLIVTDLLICLFMLSVILQLDYKVIIILITLCFPVTVTYYFIRRNVISKINMSFRKLTPQGGIILGQGIDSFAEVRIYHKENFFIDRFLEIKKITANHLANLSTTIGLPLRFFEIACILCFTGVIAYHKMYQTDQQQLITLIGLLSIAMYRIVPSLNRILINVSQIQAYAYSLTELKESLSSSIESHVEKNHPILFSKNIQLKNVSYQYKESNDVLLSDVNIKINKGEFVVLEGSSGAGKTTFINLLSGLIKDFKGCILIDDIELSSSSYYSWQNKLGIVPQTSSILQGTILSNIGYGYDANEIEIERINSTLKMTKLEEFVENLSLKANSLIGENGLTLSGGQRQRLMLARALYRNPEVLLLDEVTNQLDDANKISILETLKDLANNGTTIILASHDDAVRKFANRTFHFANNMITEIEK